MNEQEALIQSIMDAPDDDTARLAYADWQDGHGDPAHAELIRVQCHLSCLPQDDPGRGALVAREAELLQRPENAALTQYHNTFHRGMVNAARWLAGEDPFDYVGAPLERLLFLDACDFGDSNWPDVASAARVAAAPWARRVRRIAFHEFRVDARVVRALAASPHLTNLREVLFSDATTEPEAVADLVLNPSVRGVESLMIEAETAGWGGFETALSRILADKRAEQLRRLYLLAWGFSGAVADVLINSTGLEGMQILIDDRLPWVTPPVRSALQSRFGVALHFHLGGRPAIES